MDVLAQLKAEKLVCPATGQPLRPADDGEWLVGDDGSTRYPLLGGRVPVLLVDPDQAARYVEGSRKMVGEYRPKSLERQASPVARLKAGLLRDYRTRASIAAFERVLAAREEESLFLSIGGGPKRPDPLLTNLNIGPFPEVDVVADAHRLPYADESVDAIYCEAVLEHLAGPPQAVAEMFRVLKPGGRAFAATPFLQAYHGYPHHYQNFTLTGHQALFEGCGFAIEEAGTCVGPVYTLVSLTSTFLDEFSPRLIRQPAKLLWALFGAMLRPLDKLLNTRESAHVLASTTYLVAAKS